MERLCRICKIKPALFDGVKCADCRGESKIPPIPERIRPPIHNRPVKEQTAGGCGRVSGYSSNWRNLTREQIDALQGKQAGKCAICKEKRFLVLDHDHKTGKARGYLCRGCNLRVSGHEDADFIKRVTEYLDNPPADNL